MSQNEICVFFFLLAHQVSNVIFALFTEGLLKVCDKLSKPCSLEETSFSERVYGELSCLVPCCIGKCIELIICEILDFDCFISFE